VGIVVRLSVNQRGSLAISLVDLAPNPVNVVAMGVEAVAINPYIDSDGLPFAGLYDSWSKTHHHIEECPAKDGAGLKNKIAYCSLSDWLQTSGSVELWL